MTCNSRNADTHIAVRHTHARAQACTCEDIVASSCGAASSCAMRARCTHHAAPTCEDCAKCEATIQRKISQEKTAARGWEYVSQTDLTKPPFRYSDKEAKEIYDAQVAKGRFLPDEFFPDDKTKYKVLARSKVSFEDASKFSESLDATAVVAMDTDMLNALVGPDGLLQPSGRPDIAGVSESAMAAFAVENLHGIQNGKGEGTGKPGGRNNGRQRKNKGAAGEQGGDGGGPPEGHPRQSHCLREFENLLSSGS